MRKLTVFFAPLLFFVSAQTALGCLCVLEPNLTPEKDRANRLVAFEKATAVFTGEVVYLDRDTVRLKVEKIWKGEEAKEITMLTGSVENSDGTISSSSCDFGFEKGSKYLIYAYGPVGKLRTDTCSRSSLFKFAEIELQGLDKLARPKLVASLTLNSP